MSSNVDFRSMVIMSVRGTMISLVNVSESISTLRIISETSGSNSFDSTIRSIAARPCSSWIFSSSSSSDRFKSRRRCPSLLSFPRANGVTATAKPTRRACLIIISVGMLTPVSRGRTKTLTTAITNANTTPDSSSIHQEAPHMPATTAISTPESTLQVMRKNAHEPAVA